MFLAQLFLMPTRRAGVSLRSLSLVCAVLLATAAPGSQGAAQSLSVSLGASASPTGSPALNAGLTVRNVALLAGYGLSARLSGDIGTGGGIEAAGLVDIPVDVLGRRLSLYAGPGLSLRFGRVSRLRPTLIGGLAYDLDGQLGLFAEASYRVLDASSVRVGLTYSF